MKIRTVLGDIDAAQLGWCQCHEHLFIADGPAGKTDRALILSDYGKSLAEIEFYKAAGGLSFVDAQPYGCGRMAEKLTRASKQAGVNIIACTGFHKTEFFEDTEWAVKQTEEAITQAYVEEIEEGMYSSDKRKLTAKAGLIKCAAVTGLKTSALYEKLFNSAAFAARATGSPILVQRTR
ncbi:MAG: hypothetical protein ACM3S4_11785 [Burkholderiales bacterium]